MESEISGNTNRSLSASSIIGSTPDLAAASARAAGAAISCC
jgi:hypothetical protein